MIWLTNLLLSLPDSAGWYDRLFQTATARGIITYVVHTKIGSTPLTPALLEAAQAHAARSLRAEDVSARRELRQGGTWR